MEKKNKHLINAARYIHAVHDIDINEQFFNLDEVIEKAMRALDCPEVEKYWHAYQLDLVEEVRAKQRNETELEPNQEKEISIATVIPFKNKMGS